MNECPPCPLPVAPRTENKKSDGVDELVNKLNSTTQPNSTLGEFPKHYKQLINAWERRKINGEGKSNMIPYHFLTG